MSYSTVGTCSICSGPVMIPTLWGSIVPPTPTCNRCGAVAASHGPVIPMVKSYSPTLDEVCAPKPAGLQNPLGLFNFWVFKTPHGYCIDTYAGHYWKFFASAIDCKSYCMSRTEEFGEYYVYVDSAAKAKEYEACTGKRYVLPSNRSTAKNL
jgi:hypothetical protein